MPADAQEQWDKINGEVDQLSRSIKQAETAEKIAAEMAEAEGQRAEIQSSKKIERSDVFSKWVRNVPLSNEESVILRGTDPQTVGTAEHGGNLVPTEWADGIEKVMAYYAGMLEAANIVRTDSGNTIYFPVVDETAVKGSKIAEVASDTVADVTWSLKQMDAYTYTSGLMKVSYELLEDSAYNLPAHLQDLAGERLGRILNQETTVGDGSGDPNGVMTATSAGKVAASTSAITRDEILDLIHSVDRAYRGRAKSYLMLHDSTLAAIKKLTVGTSDDRPLWQPSIRDGEPDRIEGIPYIINNDMAELTDGVSSKVMAYGDFSKYNIRIARGIEWKVLQERYAEQRAIGYFAFMRFDGELINTSAIKHLALAAS